MAWGRWHGSNMPRHGFLVQDGATLVLGSERNQIRLPPYDRLDLRIRKVFPFRWGVFTLSGEVLNVLNTSAACGKGSPSRRPSVCRFSSDS
jgi:hypothetical protein